MCLLEAEGNIEWEVYTKIDLTKEGWGHPTGVVHIPLLHCTCMIAAQTFVFLNYVIAQSMHGAPQDKKFDF